MAFADDPAVILGGARTPIGRFLGALSSFSAAELGGIALRAALERSGVAPEEVDHVVLGQVLTAGAGQIPARQAAEAAGIPLTVPALTVNKVCISGMQAVILAGLMVRSGTATMVAAGGQESMSRAPHLLDGRRGTKYGDVTLADHIALDGLTDPFTRQPMGLLTEQVNDRLGVPRAEQDGFALSSHQRAAAAWADGRLDREVVPVRDRDDRPLLVRDEGIRPDTTLEALLGLRPSFRPDGTITAGNASPLSDGACALLVTTRSRAEALGLPWLAEIGATASVAGPDSSLQLQPATAIAAACEREGIAVGDLDLVEINEAFAAVAVSSTHALGLPEERVNPDGGAIAVGHPLGMSGARILLHLATELRRRGGGVGAAGICGGGGQGDAVILRVPAGE